jgi:hypothetical protein
LVRNTSSRERAKEVRVRMDGWFHVTLWKKGGSSPLATADS